VLKVFPQPLPSRELNYVHHFCVYRCLLHTHPDCINVGCMLIDWIGEVGGYMVCWWRTLCLLRSLCFTTSHFNWDILLSRYWRSYVLNTNWCIVGYYMKKACQCRVQSPIYLRHEMTSPIRTLGLWIRIPLKAWMSVCVFSTVVLSCVGSGLETDWINFNIVHPPTSCSSQSSGFPTNILYANIFPPIRATCPPISFFLTWSF
jgi:hypothetical protein